MDAKLSQAAAMMGRKGGASTSEAKVAASRENSKLGGRPAKHNVDISVWPPIGGARGQTQWRASWEIDIGTQYECYSNSKKGVIAKARRWINKSLGDV